MQAHALWNADIRGKSMWTTAPGPEQAPAAADDDREDYQRSAQDLSLPLYLDGQLW